MADYAWRPLGELLVKRGLIDAYDLEAILYEQRLTGKLLGELLVAKRIVSPVEMAAIVAEQHGDHLEAERRPAPATPPPEPDANSEQKWRPLGRILVEKELLTESGLQRVLLAQRRQGGLLGELLIQRGYVGPAQLAEALEEQRGLAVDRKVIEEVSEQALQPDSDALYEVRIPGSARKKPLHVSASFLDATDFAFELLQAENPDALEIVKVDRLERKTAWSYERPDDEDVGEDLSAA
jgi:hypothetical protein